MSAPIDRDRATQHNLDDWLHLHGVDRETCLRLLDEIGRESAKIPAYPDNVNQQSLGLDPDGVWTEVISAMCKFLPEHQSIIKDTFQGSKKIAIAGQAKSRKALTIDNGPDQYPTIMYHYFGDLPDVFVVAHEFGHALQIRASEGQFMPPVMREACAFISEGALLSLYSCQGAPLAEKFLQYWRKSNERYFNNLLIKLRSVLRSDSENYQYGWNYPIARFLALQISENFSRDSVWNVFRGGFSIREVLNKLEL